MAYDNPTRHTYSYPATNLATAFTRTIVGPLNKRGMIRNLDGQITTATTGAQAVATVTETAPNVQTSPSTPNTNPAPLDFSYAIPIAAAGTAFDSGTIPNAVQRDSNNFVPVLPANTPFVFAIAPGGAGVADLQLIVDWF